MKEKYLLLGLTALCCVGAFASCDKKEYDGYVNETPVVEELDTDERYLVGGQIDLYLQDKEGFDLAAFASLQVSEELVIADNAIAEIRNGRLYAKKAGMTYLFYPRLGIYEYYNIVVHTDAAHVESVSVGEIDAAEMNFCVGVTYALQPKTSSPCKFSDLSVIVTSETEGIAAEEFILLDETTGYLTVVGKGKCRVQITSASNKKDEGTSFVVDSEFSDETIKTAIDDYYLLKGTPKAEGATYTRTELSTIEELCFLTLPTYQESYLKTVAPALQSVIYDLRQEGAISGERVITGDSLTYTFMGSAQTQHDFTLSVQARENVTLSFENIKMGGLHLEEVENAEISVKGECAFVGGEGSTVGENGITAKNLKINLRKNTSLTCKGGNGSSTATSGARTGGAGIKANALEIDGKGDITNLSVAVFGGTGGNAVNKLEVGGQGGAGIDCAETAVIKAPINFKAKGGNGGQGGYGEYGTQPSGRGQASSGLNAGDRGSDGYTGNTGNQGGQGAKGGYSGAAIKTPVFSMLTGTLTLYGGQGGKGGVGGKGGTGGTGGKGGNGKGNWLKDGDGGQGGTGGTGGKGGQGGTGGDSYYIVETGKLSLTSGVLVEVFEGVGGNGGTGGLGGDGGRGGDGGNASTDTILDGSTNGNGGYGGRGGDGGNGGASGVTLCAFKVDEFEIATEITIHKDKALKSGGGCGGAGAGGYGGDHGSGGDNGTSRWWNQASWGGNYTSQNGSVDNTRPEYPEDWTFIKFAE